MWYLATALTQAIPAGVALVLIVLVVIDIASGGLRGSDLR